MRCKGESKGELQGIERGPAQLLGCAVKYAVEEEGEMNRCHTADKSVGGCKMMSYQ